MLEEKVEILRDNKRGSKRSKRKIASMMLMEVFKKNQEEILKFI